jgi:hypothetical protein
MGFRKTHLRLCVRSVEVVLLSVMNVRLKPSDGQLDARKGIRAVYLTIRFTGVMCAGKGIK